MHTQCVWRRPVLCEPHSPPCSLSFTLVVAALTSASGCPRVGNSAFYESFQEMDITHTRVVHYKDIVSISDTVPRCERASAPNDAERSMSERNGTGQRRQ